MQAPAQARRAVDINPNSVEAHFNLAQAYREKLQFDKGEKEYQDAVRLNAELTEKFTGRTSLKGAVPIVDASLNLNEVLTWMIGFRSDEVWKKSDDFFTLLRDTPISSAPLIGLLFVAVLALLSPRGYIKKLAFQCALCERTICQSCQKHIFHLRVCLACSEANRKVKRFSELHQLNQRQDRQMMVARIISMLLPGSGHLYLMYSIKGFILIVLFLSLLLAVFLEKIPLLIPYTWIVPSGGVGLVSAIAGLVLIYIFVFWDLAHIQETLGE